MFETATRQKYRFATNRGELGVEQLWELSLDSLDNIGMLIGAELKERETESLRRKPLAAAANATLQVKYDLVKYIIDVKETEAEFKRQVIENKQANERIQAIIDRKGEEALNSLTIDELQKLKR
jgi:hypothetical protein